MVGHWAQGAGKEVDGCCNEGEQTTDRSAAKRVKMRIVLQSCSLWVILAVGNYLVR